MRVLLLLAVVLTQALAAQAPATPAEPAAVRPVGTTSELMVDIIYPTSDAVFYIGRGAPKTDAEWNVYRGQMLMLAESANLLMMPGRARDQDKWMRDAKMLLDAGLAAFRAAKAKDVAALEALSDQLYDACVQCHADYRQAYRTRPLRQAP